MHHSRLCAVLIDCKTADVDEAAHFWAAALGRPVDLDHLEGQAAAGMAVATGSSKAAVARKAIAPYRRRVKENRRRLTRKL